MADLKEFADQLVNLTVKEVNELADILKEEYGIEPAAAAAIAVAPAAGGDGGAVVEEKTEFDVILKSAPKCFRGIVCCNIKTTNIVVVVVVVVLGICR